MKVNEGRDSSGNYAVQFSLKKDDPLLAALRALVPKGAKAHRDRETGFVMDGEADEGAAKEIGDILRAAMPTQIRERLLVEAAKAKEAEQDRRKTAAKAAASMFLGGSVEQVTDLIDDLL